MKSCLHADSCQLYSSYWKANGGTVPSDAQLAICQQAPNVTSPCDQYTLFSSAQISMAKSQEANDDVEAMRSLSFLFNAFIMMQVGACIV